MFRNALKQDLRLIATEINEKVTEKMTVADLNNVIINSVLYKNDPNQVISIGNSIIEERKGEEERQLELERVRLERARAELELEKLKTESRSSETPFERNTELCSLDTLIKSVRTLTLKLPSKPEGWGLFFSSLERAFLAKSVPNKHKAEILLNLLGEKACNIISYLREGEIEDYEKIKILILREFEPTPQACLEQFRKATRSQGETCVQFASRMKTSWDYYLKLRKVSDFDTLNQLIVSDKIFQTLDRDTVSHISIRQADGWFDPLKLSQEVDLYSISRGKSSEINSAFRKYSNSKNVSKVFFSDMKNSKCVLCSDNHPLYKCVNYKKLSVNERLSVIKNNNLCYNCLYKHKVSQCKSKYRCSTCAKSHHNSLCFSQEKNANITFENKNQVRLETSGNNGNEDTHKFVMQEQTQLSPYSAEFKPPTSSEVSNKLFTTRSNENSKIVLLSTANCFIRDERGNIHKLRCLLDSGSMCNLMTHQCAERIGLKREKVNKVLSTLNDTSINVRSRVKATLTNVEMNYQTNLDFLVVSRITDSFVPSERLNIKREEMNKIKLADENFDIPGKIDALLGVETFYEILLPGQLYRLDKKLILQNSIFGYIVSGNVATTNVNKTHCGLVKESDDLEKLLRGFWEIENIESEPLISKEAQICEEHFIKNHTRDKKGKYIVNMPLKENPQCLGNSRDIAIRKLNSLWNRLKLDSSYLKLYKQFLAEYKEMGHMIEVTDNEEKGMYFIPHLGVFRPESNTTPLRVVFNASCPTTSGVSLNAIQLNGGVTQEDLFSIMVRFRKHIFAFTADVKKMYRMIWIHPEQRKLQRIVWKEDIDGPVKTYELATVTYGTTSAPFLATRTLRQLSIDEANQFPLAAQVVLRDMYVDDVLSGAETLNEAIELQRQLIGIFERGGMSLHKWCSNDKTLVHSSKESYTFTKPAETKALGVVWNQSIDCFTFHIEIDMKSSHKKRDVLSTIARLFDPLGLLGPIITKAKIILQKLWLIKIDWHDLLPLEEEKEWKKFIASLQNLNSLKIDRCILLENAEVIELHGFSDASEVAYGAVVYCKSVTKEGKVLVKLISSKSKVSPIKRTTIPRLELCAALLLAKLIQRIKSSLQFEKSSVFLWCDSMIVLSWIKKDSYTLKTFISNRVSKIQELTEESQWHHVSSSENPADLVSRGVNPQDLADCALWWSGPEMLLKGEYPNNELDLTEQQDDFNAELKPFSDSKHLFNIKSDSFFTKFLNMSNSYSKLIRILSFIFRFFNSCKGNKRTGPLQLEEVQNAELRIIKLIQKEVFSKDLNCLKKEGKVSKDSDIKSLYPLIDENGILRVGGRLANSELNYDKRFPIILPRNNKLTMLIVEMYHKKYLHIGPQGLLFLVRQRFWPLNGRNLCRKIIHSCVVCFKAKPLTGQQVMGQLPSERITPNFPFNCVGVDFCGPFQIKYPNQRKGNLHKVFISIFVCMATKACHLEMVNNLSSDAFIATLKRFFSRRGKCSRIFSDNATNFVGSDVELKRLANLVKKPDEVLSNFLCSEGVQWNFIPPRAPNHGGLWEAGVKSVKYHLKRVVGNYKLTYEEFLTITTQVEGILNSRPLYPLSAELEDFDVLTPGHFLIGRCITAIPEPNIVHVPENRLKTWQKLTKMIQIIWKNWTNNYLTTLQQRNKWYFDRNNVRVGDMVVIKEDNLVVCKWPLGRILEVFPGKDNKVRVVIVKTKDGQFKRPISKICLLPISDNV